jgi:dTDP-4-amino-4,6-dideoxygalactose transaminase
MTELQGAVAKSQLDKIAGIVQKRYQLGMRLIRGLEEIPGVIPQKVPEDREHSFFLLVVRLDPRFIAATVSQFCEALGAEGIPAEANKITGGMATYLYDIFQRRSAFPGSAFPFVSRDLDSDVSYPKGLCPQAELAFEQTLNFNVSEFYSTDDIDQMIRATEKIARYYGVKEA